MTQALGATHSTFILPVAGPVPVPWRYMAATEHVLEYLSATGEVLSVGTYGVDFTITPNAAPENSGSLTLTLPTPLDAVSVRLLRATSAVQNFVAPPNAVGIEQQLDRHTLLIQELQDAYQRQAWNELAPFLITTNFSSLGAAEAARLNAQVLNITVHFNDLTLIYERNPASTALTLADGSTWGPCSSGPAYLQHWGIMTHASEAAALLEGATMTPADRIVRQARLAAAFGEASGRLIVKGFVEAFDLLAINAGRRVCLYSGADFNAICVHAARFNMAASAIFQGGTTAAGGCIVESLHVLCDQTAAQVSGLAADVVAYPAVFDAAGDFGTLDYIRASRCGSGMILTRTGTANNGGWRFGRCEIGSVLGEDIHIDGPQHFVNFDDIDLWAYGFAGNANLLAIYRAATGRKVFLGRCDNLMIDRLGLYSGGKIEIDATAVLPVQIDKLQLDGDGASLLLNGGKSIIGNIYGTQSASAPQLDFQIKCAGGKHIISAADLVGDSTPSLEVTGGELTFTGRIYNTNLTVGQAATVTGGRLRLVNCIIEAPAGTPLLPLIEQSGTGVLELLGCRAFVGGVEVPVAQLVKFNTAVAGNRIDETPYTRAAFAALLARGYPVDAGRSYLLDGIEYIGQPGATVIPDMPGLVPGLSGVSPDHFGGKTKAAIEAAWAYHRTICATATSATTAASTAKPFVFGPGVYNAGGAAVTLATAGVETVVRGAGWCTRLNNVVLSLGDHRYEVSNLAMEGNAKATDAISIVPRGSNLRYGRVQNVHIQGARYGLYSTGDVAWLRFTHVYAEKSVRGHQFDRCIGFTTEMCQFFSNDEQGGLVLRGGEFHDLASRYNGNKKAGLRFDGSAATGLGQIVVENKLNGTSLSGNYADPANRPTWAVTGAASNGLGGTRLTLNVAGGRHQFSNGIYGVVVAGTASYNGSWKVSNVTNTTVDISAPFTTSQTGTIAHPGYDLECIGDAGIRASQFNDLWIANCNFNFGYFKDCFGVRFDGGRQKAQIFLDGNCYGFSRVANGRGRLSDTVDDGDEDGISGTWSAVPFSGQNYGFVETISSVDTAFTGEISMITRAPDPTVALIGNNIQAYRGESLNGSAGKVITGPMTVNGPLTLVGPMTFNGVDLAAALANFVAQSITLSAISASAALAATNIHIYDTRQDADGGAWRFNKFASWYNEPLNTAVRGARREFPALAVIIATASSFEIRDGDDPTLPLWKKHQTTSTSGGLGVLRLLASYPITGIAALNGRIHFASATAGYHFLDFAGDFAGKVSNTGSTSGYVFPLASYYNKDITTGLTPGFVNNSMNAIAAVVLPGAPINPMTGLPTATIIIGTNGGLSIRKHDGTMANSAATGAVYKVRVDGTRVIYQQAGVGQFCTIDLVGIATGFSPIAFTEVSVPAMKQAVASTSKLMERGAAGSAGVTLIQPDLTTPAASMVDYITADFQTGWMVGDIKGCWLSSIDPTAIVGGTVSDRSVNALALNVTGTIARSVVQPGAELMGYGGWAAGVNELTLTHASIANTLYGMCWVEISAGKWALQRGVMSSSPIEGVTISGTTITVGGSARKALLRLSATTPTANQIARIEADEYRLFEDAAACTLYGADSDVKAMIQDKATGLVHIGTGAGRSSFQGLTRVSNTTTAVMTAIAAASGMIAEQ